MEVKVSATSKQPTGFLDLPLELRLQIYRYCLVRSNPVLVRYVFIVSYRTSDWGIRDEKKSLLLVSKKVGFEALEVLYGENVFQVDLYTGGQKYSQEHLAEANRQRIRKLEIVMRPQGLSCAPRLDSTMWSPIFANLNKLSIVARQPSRAPMYIHVPGFEQDVQNWAGWFRDTLQFVVRQLPSSCIVEVDDDGGEEIGTVMRECLPRGYRKVQTLTGDFFFMRNEYSTESDYWDEEDDDDDGWLQRFLIPLGRDG